MAKKGIVDPVPDSPVEVDHPHDPLTEIGLDYGGGVSYREMPTEGRQRRVFVNGVDYEHTHEDKDGVWVYRHLK